MRRGHTKMRESCPCRVVWAHRRRQRCRAGNHRRGRRHREDREPDRTAGGFAVAAVELRRQQPARGGTQGSARSRRGARHQCRRGEQRGQPHAELHRGHGQYQSARPRRRVHAGVAERQETSPFRRADGRWFELRGPGGAGAGDGNRTRGNSEGRRRGHLWFRSGGRRRQLHHTPGLRGDRGPGRAPQPDRQRFSGRHHRRWRGRRKDRRRRRIPVGGRLSRPHQSRAHRSRLAAPRHQRLRQSRQFQCAVAWTYRRRCGMRALRRTAAGVGERRNALPLRLRPAGHGGAQRRARASLGQSRLALERFDDRVDGVRLRAKRHQSRCVAQLSGAQYAEGAGQPSRQHIRRRRLVPGSTVRLRTAARSELLPARHGARSTRRQRPVIQRDVLGYVPGAGSQRRPAQSPRCHRRQLPGGAPRFRRKRLQPGHHPTRSRRLPVLQPVQFEFRCAPGRPAFQPAGTARIHHRRLLRRRRGRNSRRSRQT